MGTVFTMNTDGTGFRTIHAFSGSDGVNPQASLTLSGFTNLYEFAGQDDDGYPYSSLVLDGNTLYGTTTALSAYGYGSVFRVDTDGTEFTTLYQFSGGTDS